MKLIKEHWSIIPMVLIWIGIIIGSGSWIIIQKQK